MSSQLIIIEGLIGVGKSTLAEKLADVLNYNLVKEPVLDNPYLDKFYKDPKRYALEMQFWLMSKRFSMHQEAIQSIWQTGQGVIMDRSIYGDNIFAQQNYDDDNIDKPGIENYENMRDIMLKYLMIPHITIFLNASTKTCIDRIKQRNRTCEVTVQESYLTGLQEHYKKLLTDLEKNGSNIINLNWENFLPTSTVLQKLKQKNLLPKKFLEYRQILKPEIRDYSSPQAQKKA